MLRVWWFGEYSPAQQIVFDEVLDIIQNNYELFGYTPINTPALERNDVLLSKAWEETSKQIFWVYGLAQWPEDTKDYSLRFDLTVPFARYVLDWQNDITFPFKRYQIQKVRRWERQQKWRFKEFWQADVDVIRNADLPNLDDMNIDTQDDIWANIFKYYLFYDSEVIFVWYKTLLDIFTKFSIQAKPILKISNRMIITSFLDYITDNDADLSAKLASLIDKFQKIWQDSFVQQVKDLWLAQDKVDQLVEFITMDVDLSKLKSLSWYIDSPKFNQWIASLYADVFVLSRYAKQSGIEFNCDIDFSIIRGLDYYTGIVFETFIDQAPEYGSFYSWWRYDKLTDYINQNTGNKSKNTYLWVWASIGLSRLMSYIFENNLVDIQKSSITDYLCVNFGPTFADIVSIASSLRQQWKSVEIFPYPAKLAKQFKYADKKWIRYVLIYWEQEKQDWIYKIKDMSTGQEQIVQL